MRCGFHNGFKISTDWENFSSPQLLTKVFQFKLHKSQATCPSILIFYKERKKWVKSVFDSSMAILSKHTNILVQKGFFSQFTSLEELLSPANISETFGAKTPLPGAEFKIWPKVCSGGDLLRKSIPLPMRNYATSESEFFPKFPRKRNYTYLCR